MVGCAITEISAQPASWSSSTATTVFGSCISARIPSCIRAPPEAEIEISGTPAVAALSHARANFSPVTDPIEPPMNEKSITASSQEMSSIVARADDERVAEAGRDLRLREPLVVGAEVEEAERVGRAQVGCLLGEAALVRELLDPLVRPTGK